MKKVREMLNDLNRDSLYETYQYIPDDEDLHQMYLDDLADRVSKNAVAKEEILAVIAHSDDIKRILAHKDRIGRTLKAMKKLDE